MTKANGKSCGCTDLGLLILRIAVGVVFIYHGSDKLFTEGAMDGLAGHLEKMQLPAPMVMAWAVALSEFVGGIGLLIGLLTRIMAIPVLCVMAVAVFMVHLDNGFNITKGGFEYPMTLGLIAITLILTGGGALAVDRLLFCRRCKKVPHEPAV